MKVDPQVLQLLNERLAEELTAINRSVFTTGGLDD
jgi:bacterioferritin (cytochrome b1)